MHYLRLATTLLVSGCFIKPATPALSDFQFMLMPYQYDLSSCQTWATLPSTSTPEECLIQALIADNTTIALAYDDTTGDCAYATKLKGYFYRSEQLPLYYVRSDNRMKPENTDCPSDQDAEYLLLKWVYDDRFCPEGDSQVDGSSCKSSGGINDYGLYTSGYNTDDTIPVLSSTEATEQMQYYCDWNVPNSVVGRTGVKMKWANTWWCYYYFKVPAENRTKDLLTNNVCATWVASGAQPETIAGNQAEMRYMYWLDPTYLAFLGAVRVDGTSTFTWYDGSDASSLPWAPGSPSSNMNKTLVSVNKDGTVTDRLPEEMIYLWCTNAATLKSYDYSGRFF